MTGCEKKKIYDFLKAASSWALGYTPHSFEEEPYFKDDHIEENIPSSHETQILNVSSSLSENKVNSQEKQDLHTEIETSIDSSTLEQGKTILENEEKTKSQDEKKKALMTLSEKVALCSNCVLCQKRKNSVFGEGCVSPYVMVVGEGPGEEEDKSGRPFVGKAGELLDKMLSSIALSRKTNCYIANIVKCRPPMNRTPMPDEAMACSGFLQAQIALLKPRYILAVGRTAVQNLLGTAKGLGELRGKWFEYSSGTKKIPLLATYHPSALLRDESKKRPAWEDLKVFRSRLQKECPEYTGQENGSI